MSPNFVIRAAESADVPIILSFIRELAEYEKLAYEVVASEAGLRQGLFGEQPVARVLIAQDQGQPAGFALFFLNFSTFLAKPGIFLEDLYVRPAFRGKGIGKALLKELVKIAAREGYGRVEWAVLDWNKPAIEFYRSLGARLMTDWRMFRLDSAAITSLTKGDTD